MPNKISIAIRFLRHRLIVIGVILVLTHCAFTPTGEPTSTPSPLPPPAIKGFSQIPSGIVPPGETIKLQVNIEQIERQPITEINWVVSQGTILKQDSSIIDYHVPEEPGEYEIEAVLEYGAGEQVGESWVIVVKPTTPATPTPPDPIAATTNTATETAVTQETATAETNAAINATLTAIAATETSMANKESTAAAETARFATETTEAYKTATAVAAVTTQVAGTATAKANLTATTEAIPIPTPVPTPISGDAVVAADGIVLYKNPRLDSDLVKNDNDEFYLEKGKSFYIEKRVQTNSQKDDQTYDGWWIAVSFDNNLSDDTEGWIKYNPNIITNGIELTKKWEEIPEIYQYGPLPLFPNVGRQRSIDETTTFEWEEYPLKEHQYYSVIIVPAGRSDLDACIHTQLRVPKLDLKPKDFGCTSGSYYWGVGVATDLAKGQGERVWRDDSVYDERFPLGLSAPPPPGGSKTSGGSDDTGGFRP